MTDWFEWNGKKCTEYGMCDPYRDMPAGLRGKVIHVDNTGTVHVSWENGSSLGAVHGFDRIR